MCSQQAEAKVSNKEVNCLAKETRIDSKRHSRASQECSSGLLRVSADVLNDAVETITKEGVWAW